MKYLTLDYNQSLVRCASVNKR